MQFKKFLSTVIATVCLCAGSGVSAYAGNSVQGLSSIGGISPAYEITQREYIGLSSTAYVFIKCNVTTGTVELKTTGFNPNTNSLMIYAPRNYSDFLEKPNPLGCSVEFWARESRVVANGRIST